MEYGSAAIELHKDSIKKGQKVVIVDDLIATGGTVKACASLVEELGGEVAKIVFLMELAGLKGREQLSQYDVSSLIIYEREIGGYLLPFTASRREHVSAIYLSLTRRSISC